MAEVAAAAAGAGAVNPAIAAKLPQGIGPLNDVVDFQKVVCLNGTHQDPASIFRQGNTSVLSSDADEQLLITLLEWRQLSPGRHFDAARWRPKSTFRRLRSAKNVQVQGIGWHIRWMECWKTLLATRTPELDHP